MTFYLCFGHTWVPAVTEKDLFEYLVSPTITFGCFHSHSVSSQSMQVLSPGGDSSCSWVLVRALGHNLDERRDFTFDSPTWGVHER